MPDAGEVVWLEFPGAVTTKRRPAVVLSSSAYYASRPDVIVGLVTSQIARNMGTTDHVLADWAMAGLRLPSAFRAYLATLPQSAIFSTMGRLSPTDWLAVSECVKRALSM